MGRHFVAYTLAGNVRKTEGPFGDLYDALRTARELISIHGRTMPIDINDGRSIEMGGNEIHSWCDQHPIPQSK